MIDEKKCRGFHHLRKGLAISCSETLHSLSIKKIACIVLGGFILQIFFHAIGGYYVAPILARYFPSVPHITVSMIFSSVMSLMIAIIFVAVRTKSFPRFMISRETVMYIVAGIVMSWIVCFFQVLFEGKGIPVARKILETPSPYYYVNLFLLIFWGPFVEEILYRGYFFELLRQRSTDATALLASSFLFIIPHGIWGGFDSGLIFIFLGSVVFTLMYIQGGLIPSVAVHAFANFYLFYLNMG